MKNTILTFIIFVSLHTFAQQHYETPSGAIFNNISETEFLMTYFKNSKTYVEKRNVLGENLSIDSTYFDFQDDEVHFLDFLRFGTTNKFLSILYKGNLGFQADSIKLKFSIYSSDDNNFVSIVEDTIFASRLNFCSKNDSTFIVLSDVGFSLDNGHSIYYLNQNGQSELSNFVDEMSISINPQMVSTRNDTLNRYSFLGQPDGIGILKESFDLENGLNINTNPFVIFQTDQEFITHGFFDKNDDTLLFAYYPYNTDKSITLHFLNSNLDNLLTSTYHFDTLFNLKNVNFKNGLVHVLLISETTFENKLITFNNSFQVICELNFNSTYLNQNFTEMNIDYILGNTYLSLNNNESKNLFKVNNCNSIEVLIVSEDKKYDFSIYPNPTNDYIKIKMNNLNLEYEILSSDGRVVQRGECQDNYVDVKGLKNGVYSISIKNEQFRTDTRFVKI